MKSFFFRLTWKGWSPQKIDWVSTMAVLFLSVLCPFEATPLHNTAPPLSLCHAGAEAWFEGWEAHARLGRSRAGRGNICKDGTSVLWKAQVKRRGLHINIEEFTLIEGEMTYTFSGNVWRPSCGIFFATQDFLWKKFEKKILSWLFYEFSCYSVCGVTMTLYHFTWYHQQGRSWSKWGFLVWSSCSERCLSATPSYALSECNTFVFKP